MAKKTERSEKFSYFYVTVKTTLEETYLVRAPKGTTVAYAEDVLDGAELQLESTGLRSDVGDLSEGYSHPCTAITVKTARKTKKNEKVDFRLVPSYPGSDELEPQH